MVGGGDRGLALARELVAEGHAVRIAAAEDRRPEIEAIGCECWIGDPDVVGTLRYALESVTVLLWLLGDDATQELHGSRLEMMLERTIDTTARGVIYESRGAHGRAGADIVTRMARKNEIPFVLLDADPSDLPAWLSAARSGIASIVGADRSALTS